MDPRRALLDWYGHIRRDLPWRRSRDPWAIWLAEVMLQQTRVEAVVPYYERFLARFPSLSALAEASEEEVLALWSGLGYYRRARQLHRAAGLVVAAGGDLPPTAAELERLPGIGPYTAAAIASMAFGEAVAVLDGNVARVMARRCGERGRASLAAVRRRLLEAATALLDPHRPGDSNQALMELGATVCLPRKPRCGGCPLAPGCVARHHGQTDEIPAPLARARAVREDRVAALLTDRHGRWLLVRRGDDEGTLGGLWELPTLTGAEPDAELFAARYGGHWSFATAARSRIRHAITFRRIELSIWPAEWRPEGHPESVAEGSFGGRESRWVDPGAGEELALTGITRRILRQARPGGQAPGSS